MSTKLSVNKLSENIWQFHENDETDQFEDAYLVVGTNGASY